MSAIKILRFTDVYNAGEIGEGVDRGDMPVAFWTVAGPSKPVSAWMDEYAGLDGQTHKLIRNGVRKTDDGPIKTPMTYQVQFCRITGQPGKWGVVVSNVTRGTVNVQGLLKNVGKASTLKELCAKLWDHTSFLSPYPGVSEAYFAETKMERRYREGRFAVFTKPEKAGIIEYL